VLTFRASRSATLGAALSGLLLACDRTGAAGGAATVQPPVDGQLPCAVQNILRAKCESCHGHPTRETAPMSLTTWQELHAPAPGKTEPAAPVFQRMLQRIRDTRSPMPPRGRPQLTEAERSTLEIWLVAGAKPGAACAATGGDAGRGSEVSPTSSAAQPPSAPAAKSSSPPGASAELPKAGNAGAAGSALTPQAAATAPGAGAGTAAVGGTMAGAPALPELPTDAECEYVDILARNDLSNNPYRVPADTRDDYKCFLFDLAFEQPTQALSFAPVTDNLAVMHHWLLYSMETYGSREAIVDCEYPPGYRMIAGGTSSTNTWAFPPEVGMAMGRGLFMLEVHYNNIGKAETTDRSGVRICTTKRLRPNTATVSWLGVEAFIVPPRAASYQVGNRCRPTSRQPIHLLRYWPHMHNLGVRAVMRLTHADGRSESLHDAPYAFDDQVSYPTSYVMQPGDSLTTTCYFDNPNNYPVAAGFKTSDEMCNHFVIAYPAEALTNDALSAWNVACVGPPTPPNSP